MGFSIKLAPGIRIRASSRGIRTSLGPRAARVHVGGGRTGVSSGFGPVGFYGSLGGRRPRSSRSTSATAYQRQLAAQQRQAVQAQRAFEAQRLVDVFLHILNLHRTSFPPAQPPLVPQPAQPDRKKIYRYYRQHALSRTHVLQRKERARAKELAAQWTEAEVQRQWSEACQQREQLQRHFDERWRALRANQPEAVIETLNEAFEDNEVPSAAVDVDRGEVSLVLLVPPMHYVVPERMPTQTAAGNVSLSKLSQTDRSSYYTRFVCGQALVTVREALAVAPGIASTRVVALRRELDDVYGKPQVSCVLAATFTRRDLDGIQWQTADAAFIVEQVATERVWNLQGRARRLEAVNLAFQPEIAKLVRAVDLRELASG